MDLSLFFTLLFETSSGSYCVRIQIPSENPTTLRQPYSLQVRLLKMSLNAKKIVEVLDHELWSTKWIFEHETYRMWKILSVVGIYAVPNECSGIWSIASDLDLTWTIPSGSTISSVTNANKRSIGIDTSCVMVTVMTRNFTLVDI